MRFSLVTITYNAEKYLEETLASTQNQEFKDFEHIVWDGGSSDRTVEIVSSFPHVKLYQGKDRGISDAMNKGAEKACGDFIIHLHADDALAHSRALLYVDSCLKQHPSIKWLYGEVGLIDNEGKSVGKVPFKPYHEGLLTKYNMISHPGVVLCRKLFFESGGFDISLKYCMDYDLWLRLAKSSPPFPLKTPLALFRTHSGSLSTSSPKEVAREAYLVRNRYITSPLLRFKSWRTYKKRMRAR